MHDNSSSSGRSNRAGTGEQRTDPNAGKGAQGTSVSKGGESTSGKAPDTSSQGSSGGAKPLNESFNGFQALRDSGRLKTGSFDGMQQMRPTAEQPTPTSTPVEDRPADPPEQP